MVKKSIVQKQWIISCLTCKLRSPHYYLPQLNTYTSMADLSFAKDSKLQTGEGDSSYMDFIHKYTSIVGVSSRITFHTKQS